MGHALPPRAGINIFAGQTEMLRSNQIGYRGRLKLFISDKVCILSNYCSSESLRLLINVGILYPTYLLIEFKCALHLQYNCN